jgi:DNA gyrase subunit A
MLAIYNNRPETMGIKAIIKASVDFQYEVATRKYTNLLAKEMERKEIQEGLIKACNVIDLVIEILRGSKDRTMAKNCLVDGITDGIKFKSRESAIMAAQLRFTEKQANAILEMRLYKLIGLELEALINEHEETMANIYRYEDILDRKDSMAQVIINELEGFKKEFSKKRKTVIDNAEEAVYKEKELEEMDIVFLMDRFGYAKTIDMNTYERNKEAADAENKYVIVCKNTGKVCLFTDIGQMHTIKMMDLPFGKFRDKGIPVDNVSNYASDKEEIVYMASQTELNLRQLLFVTGKSMMKIVDGGEFDVAKRTVSATKLSAEDKLVYIASLTGQQNIILQSKEGYFLRFPISEISEMKKTAVGVRGMKLGDKDLVENVYLTGNTDMTMIEYKDKSIMLNSLKGAHRDGKGTKVRA